MRKSRGSAIRDAVTATAGWYHWTRGGLNVWDVPRLKGMIGKPSNANTVENEVDSSAATGAR